MLCFMLGCLKQLQHRWSSVVAITLVPFSNSLTIIFSVLLCVGLIQHSGGGHLLFMWLVTVSVVVPFRHVEGRSNVLSLVEFIHSHKLFSFSYFCFVKYSIQWSSYDIIVRVSLEAYMLQCPLFEWNVTPFKWWFTM